MKVYTFYILIQYVGYAGSLKFNFLTEECHKVYVYWVFIFELSMQQWSDIVLACAIRVPLFLLSKVTALLEKDNIIVQYVLGTFKTALQLTIFDW